MDTARGLCCILVLALATTRGLSMSSPSNPLALVECSVNEDAFAVPGIDAVEEAISVFIGADDESDTGNGGRLTFYMKNTVTIGAIQWILQCDDMLPFESGIDIDQSFPGPTLEDEDISLAANGNIVFLFGVTGGFISPGFRELCTLVVSANCPASNICYESATYTNDFGVQLTSECGECTNPCLCDQVPPPPPSPPVVVPDDVPNSIADVCIAAGVTNFVVLSSLGTNTYMGTDASECIVGTNDEDNIFGSGGDDIIFGRNGADFINGGSGSDTIYGNLGSDVLTGSLGDDLMFGGKGTDVMMGDFGDDLIYGNGGADTIIGGPGADTLRGGTGGDKLIGCPIESGGEDDIIVAEVDTVKCSLV